MTTEHVPSTFAADASGEPAFPTQGAADVTGWSSIRTRLPSPRAD